jgi:hypothetical protein
MIIEKPTVRDVLKVFPSHIISYITNDSVCLIDWEADRFDMCPSEQEVVYLFYVYDPDGGFYYIDYYDEENKESADSSICPAFIAIYHELDQVFEIKV